MPAPFSDGFQQAWQTDSLVRVQDGHTVTPNDLLLGDSATTLSEARNPNWCPCPTDASNQQCSVVVDHRLKKPQADITFPVRLRYPTVGPSPGAFQPQSSVGRLSPHQPAGEHSWTAIQEIIKLVKVHSRVIAGLLDVAIHILEQGHSATSPIGVSGTF